MSHSTSLSEYRQQSERCGRPLTSSEISILESQGNFAVDGWRHVSVMDQPGDNHVVAHSLKRIRGNVFSGQSRIAFRSFSGSVKVHGVSLPAGLYNSHFAGECLFDSDCRVSDTSIVSDVYVGKHAAVVGCGVVSGGETADRSGNHAHRLVVRVGPEGGVGGRDVYVHIHDNYSTVVSQVLYHDAGSVIHSGGQWDAHETTHFAHLTVIHNHATVVNCPKIIGSFIGSYASVAGSTVTCSYLTSAPSPASVSTNDNSEESSSVRVQDQAMLHRCVLQQGCVAEKGCQLDAVFMMDHAHAGEGGRISQSVLAPDASVAGGECHRSLVGPSVGFHHHSLLIATIWPQGRGNIAYGAKVGANHTGRLNDQECWVGEGCFFGLGCSLKFPVNLLDSPYTIIAPDTTVSPQRLSFPFSLVLPLAHMPAGVGEAGRPAIASDASILKPGWVLYGNPYLLERAGSKFSNRRTARQHNTALAVLKPSVIELVKDALDRLQSYRHNSRPAAQELPASALVRSDAGVVGGDEALDRAVVPTSDELVEMDEVKVSEGSAEVPPLSTEGGVESGWATEQAGLAGAGRCLVLEKDITLAIGAYQDLIHRYCLHGLLMLLLQLADSDQDWSSAAAKLAAARSSRDLRLDSSLLRLRGDLSDMESASEGPVLSPAIAAAVIAGVVVTDWWSESVSLHQLAELQRCFPHILWPEVFHFAQAADDESSAQRIAHETHELARTHPSEGSLEEVSFLPLPASSTGDLDVSLLSDDLVDVASKVEVPARLRGLLVYLVQLEDDAAQRVLQCRQRDGERGRGVIPDYDRVNGVGADVMKDDIVRLAVQRAARIRSCVDRFTYL